uniref:Cse1 domain-containing protein n=1 Tax=Macrostomum lignano TaxID=282301 RepID=A0A1I8IIN8_9PLAT
PIVYRRVVPLVAENLWLSADLTPFVLPCLLRIIMHSTAEEFRSHLSEHTLAVLRRPRTAQTNLVLVEHTDILVERLTDEEVRADLLPLVIATLESNSASGQEAALNAFCVLQDQIDDNTMRRLILPKAKLAFVGGASLNMQVKALACLDQLIGKLDKMIILDEILPFLLEINFSDRDIYMAVI